MPRRLARRDFVWLALISGILVLLAVQLPYAARGFDHPSATPLMRLLESPGLALGWGGVALVLVAAAYSLVTWTRGKSPGQVLAVLGAVVFALAIGAFAGVLAATVERGGGKIGGSVAHMLVDSLGRFPAVLLLAVVSIPGLLLALAPLILDSPNRPVKGGRTTDTLAKAWYPERKVSDDGTEVPVQFEGSSDVGAIRYRDPNEPPAPPPPPPAPVDVPDRGGPSIPGVRFKDEPATAPTTAAPPDDSDAHHAPLPPGVRWSEDAPKPSPEAPPQAEASTTAVLAPPEVAPPEPAKPAPARKSRGGKPAAKPKAPTDTSPDAESPPAAPPAAPPKTDVATDAPPPAGYRAKLAASGMFERATPTVARSGKPPTPQPMPATHESIEAALQSLFSSLPVEELPPARTPEPEAPPAPAEPPKEDPNQTILFTPKPATEKVEKKAPKPAPAPKAAAKPAPAPKAAEKPAKAPPGKRAAPVDPLFQAAADAAVERGSASLVLLKRKLDVGYERAEHLMAALVAEGIVGEMTASGSRPALVTAEEWAKRRKPA